MMDEFLIIEDVKERLTFVSLDLQAVRTLLKSLLKSLLSCKDPLAIPVGFLRTFY
jgi:hypothetical protein